METKRKLHLRFTKATAWTLAAAALCSVLGMGAQSAAATPDEHPISQSKNTSHNEAFGGITASQWEEIAAAAEGAGDQESAQAAREAAQVVHNAVEARSGETSTYSQKSQAYTTSLAKKLIKIALKEGRRFLPNWLKKWADKIYDLVDLMDTSSELAIATLLIKNGIPADLAWDIARWIMTFV